MFGGVVLTQNDHVADLSFLDNGLVVEPTSDTDVSAEISKFIEYCRSLGKKPGQLTEEELQRFYEMDNPIKKVKCISDNYPVSLIKGKVYDCLGEEHGHYRIIDEDGYDENEDIQGYLYPKSFFIEVDNN